MAVAKMQKLNIVGHNKDEEAIVDYLHDTGFIEISSWKKPEETTKINIEQKEQAESSLTSRLAELKFAIDFLEQYKTQSKRQMLEKLLNPKIEITEETIEEIKNNNRISEITKEVSEFDQELRQLQAKKEQVKEEEELLENWRDLHISLTEQLETKTSKIIFGQIDDKQYLEFVRELDKKIKKIEVRKINTKDKVNNLVVIFLKEQEKEVEKISMEYNFKTVELPSIDESPVAYLDKSDQKIEEIAAGIEKLENKIKEYSQDYLNKLKIAYDITDWQAKQVEIQKKFAKTKRAFSMIGWLKKTDYKTFKAGLEKLTEEVEVIELEPEENEPIPVTIQNSKLITPFESITTLYGIPKSSEVDPTPFLSLFFIIFFALCLTDAGYGILLMVLSFAALKIMKPKGGAEKLIKLLFIGGFVTLIIGALTGGWFGLILTDLPPGIAFLATPLLWLQQVDPIKNPMTILILSLALGFIHLWFALGIDIWWKLKTGEKKDALLGTLPWFIFFTALAIFILTSTGLITESFKDTAKYIVYGSLILMVITQGYKEKNIGKKAFFGIGSLYGIIGYLSDLLSYSRLLALGLTTAVIAMVINIIAVLFRDMIPYVGTVVMVVILIGGHLFNLIINVLGAYIHSGRLQFVEFFPKFFEGGGKTFEPFQRESKYVIYKKFK